MFPVLWLITVTIRDDKGRIGYVRLHVLHLMSNGFDNLTSYAQLIAEEIDVIIRGRVVGCTLSLEVPLDPDDFKPVPQMDSDVEETGVFIFQTENQSSVRLSIPTFDENFCFPGSQIIDVDGDMELSLIIAGIIESPLGETYPQACDSRGNDITPGLLRAYFNFKARGKKRRVR